MTSARAYFWLWFGIALLLFVLHGAADYQLQAEQHGWGGLLWERFARAPHWPWYIDWMPHDAWHITQMLWNLSFLAGVVAACEVARRHVMAYTLFLRASVALQFGAAWLLYIVGRGIGFSLPYHVMN